MVIYIDILIILNFFINLLIILGASAVTGRPAQRLRLFLSALFGGLYSLTLLLPETGRAVSFLIKLSGLVAMTFTAFGFISVRLFLRALFGVCLVSFSFAGVFLGIYLVFKPDRMLMANGSVYFDIGVRFFVFTAVVCYLFIKLVLYFVKRNAADNALFTLTLTFNSKSAVIKGLTDTGDSLTDVFTNKPVTTVESSSLKRILPDALPEERKSVVPVRTAVGDGLLTTLRFDRMIIESGNKRYEISSPLIALCDRNLSDGEYQALINPRIFEYGSNKNETSQTDKQNTFKASASFEKGADSLHRQRRNPARAADRAGGKRGFRFTHKR